MGQSCISIHAPAKGATAVGGVKARYFNISIHAPAKGATGAASGELCVPGYFNPRSREGSDRSRPKPEQIHRDFNPRSREGSDFIISCIDSTIIIFQSTLPRRERQSRIRLIRIKIQFQSTLPRRERHTRWIFFDVFPIFQSTLPRRERHSSISAAAGANAFQSTLPRRERPALLIFLIHYILISIHAPAKGATEKSAGRN